MSIFKLNTYPLSLASHRPPGSWVHEADLASSCRAAPLSSSVQQEGFALQGTTGENRKHRTHGIYIKQPETYILINIMKTI